MASPKKIELPRNTLLADTIRKSFDIAGVVEELQAEGFTLNESAYKFIEKLRLAQIREKALVDPSGATPQQVQDHLAMLHTRIEVFTDLLLASDTNLTHSR